MKRFLLSLFAFVMLSCLLTIAQETKPGTQQPTATTTDDTMKDTMKEVTLSGKVGDDGKSFVTTKDNKSWTVANPEALKGHEGQEVKLKAQVDQAKNEIHVVSVKKAKGAAAETGTKPMSEEMPK